MLRTCIVNGDVTLIEQSSEGLNTSSGQCSLLQYLFKILQSILHIQYVNPSKKRLVPLHIHTIQLNLYIFLWRSTRGLQWTKECMIWTLYAWVLFESILQISWFISQKVSSNSILWVIYFRFEIKRSCIKLHGKIRLTKPHGSKIHVVSTSPFIYLTR